MEYKQLGQEAHILCSGNCGWALNIIRGCTLNSVLFLNAHLLIQALIYLSKLNYEILISN